MSSTDQMPPISSEPIAQPEASITASEPAPSEPAPERSPADLSTLKARALKAYATKSYSEAADLYAEACALQSEANGESNPANAHLLFLYGKSLFRTALSKSDILGAPKEKEEPSKPLGTVTEEAEDGSAKGKQGLFQFTGDENWDDEDEEMPEADGEAEEEEEDEMKVAWEILDLARIGYEKQLAAAAGTDGETEQPLTHEQTHDLKAELADVYDLLGEISIESEAFEQAANDSASSLKLRHEVYPVHNTLIAEGHFKMALALEFSAMPTGEKKLSDEEVLKLRAEAVEHLQKAIDSCKLRIEKEAKGEESAEVKEVRSMIAELEEKKSELKNPPKKITATDDDEAMVQGLLGTLMQKDPVEMQKEMAKIMGSANDLSGLVKKKAKKPAEAGPSTEAAAAEPSNGVSKRKLEEVEKKESDNKKVRVEEVADAEA